MATYATPNSKVAPFSVSELFRMSDGTLPNSIFQRGLEERMEMPHYKKHLRRVEITSFVTNGLYRLQGMSTERASRARHLLHCKLCSIYVAELMSD